MKMMAKGTRSGRGVMSDVGINLQAAAYLGEGNHYTATVEFTFSSSDESGATLLQRGRMHAEEARKLANRLQVAAADAYTTAIEGSHT